ncbi:MULTISPECIES: GGDEF domain-containing protein [unclassified Treponema]|uniref:GGDEF domain-containing protein n=1 Tax=unclassified Treponema TaxID=2638727 RepID=UPI0020A2B007|nr:MULTISPECIES: GGDEF domain-containing protein [unclassified Treponema]UTC66787.1 GGDEF domain-containing protein [Treponema sp. OMZ 789]UTC69520.1 GGDEF domain-containing protein [Treponema sp. OMZ 790]UTC72234.1 GGDEF domain-containing protein [Treponema sp. OMZ 791]
MNKSDCANKDIISKNKLYNFFNDNIQIANDEINSLQVQFRLIHIRTQLIIIIIACCFEIAYYFIDKNEMSLSFDKYFFKYVLIPFSVNFSLYLITKIFNNKCCNSKTKNYFVMLSSLFQAFFYIVVHQAFVTIYAGFLVMIFLSTVYNDKMLTGITSLFSFTGTVLAVFFIKYDGDHNITSQYILDFMVLGCILIVCYITAKYILNHNKAELSKILNAIQEKEKYWYGMMVDDLSGLYSRAAFRTYINRIQDYEGDVYIVIIDLDDFKKINDTYGHLYGDEVIRTLGQTLNSYSGDLFTAFRYGGEEFLVIIKSDEGCADKLMNESKNFFNQNCFFKLQNPNISFSAGMSKFSKGKLITEIIGQADSALYKAKKEGKNKIVIYGSY